jgi:hypothetical protein
MSLFWHRTVDYQFGRVTPMAIWTLPSYHPGWPDVTWLQHALQFLVVVGIVVLAVFPRAPKDAVAVAALGGAGVLLGAVVGGTGVALGAAVGGVVGAAGAVAVAGGGTAAVAVVPATGVAVAVVAGLPPQAASSARMMLKQINRPVKRDRVLSMDDYVSSGAVPPAPGAAVRISDQNRYRHRASTSQQAQAAAVPNLGGPYIDA